MSTQYVEITVAEGYADCSICEEKVEQLKQNIAQSFTEEYGGATAITGTGYYKSHAGYIVEEAVTIIKSFVIGRDIGDTPKEWAERIKEELDQECVLLNLNGTIEFV